MIDENDKPAHDAPIQDAPRRLAACVGILNSDVFLFITLVHVIAWRDAILGGPAHNAHKLALKGDLLRKNREKAQI